MMALQKKLPIQYEVLIKNLELIDEQQMEELNPT